MAKPRDNGAGRPKRDFLAGYELYRHEEYVDKLKDLPDGSDERIVIAIRQHIAVFRRSKRTSGLMVAELSAHFSPGYKGPAAEILLGVVEGFFVLLDIRLGGFSEEELVEYDKAMKHKP